MKLEVLLAVAVAGCSRAPATGPQAAAPPPAAAGRRPAKAVVNPVDGSLRRWNVAFERSIGHLGTAPVFADNGDVISGGQRFDRHGTYRGLLAMEVGGGRMIANIRALLRDGRALAEVSADGDDRLMLGRADRPPEKGRSRASGSFGGLAVSADETRAAIHAGVRIVIWSLPTLAPIDRVELAGDWTSGPSAVAFLADGSLAYTVPCQGRSCAGAGIEVRGKDGRRRMVRDAGVEAVAFADAGNVAAVHDGKVIEVIALPSGASRGRIELPGTIEQGTTDAGALAIAPGGDDVAAVVCSRLTVWTVADIRAGGFAESYAADVRYAGGEDGCAYVAGLRFAPDGGSLALAARDLTVLRPGPARQLPQVGYRPALPAGFVAAGADVQGIYMPPEGTGMAAAPRVLGWWTMDDGGWAQARAVARDAAEMAGFTELERWADAILTRFEPMVRDETQPGQVSRKVGDILPYRRAFTDERGRRILEYSILVRGGCEEMDRHVRWIEDGQVLLEIDIETIPGTAASTLAAWVTAFFDAPLRTAPPPGRAFASHRFRRGGC